MEMTPSPFSKNEKRDQLLEETKPLSFKTLSNGLGFHPFSEGLPYAPVSKKKTGSTAPMGLGAEVAGPVRPVSIRSVPSTAPKGLVTAQQIRTELAPQPQIVPPQPSYKVIEGRWYIPRRVAAFVFDLAMTLLVFSISVASFFTFFHANVGQLITPDTLPSLLFLFAFVHWAFVALQDLIFKTSLGKNAFGLSLNADRFAIMLRSACIWISFGLAGIGVFWALFDPKKRTLHDLISGTQPQ